MPIEYLLGIVDLLIAKTPGCTGMSSTQAYACSGPLDKHCRMCLLHELRERLTDSWIHQEILFGPRAQGKS